MTRRLPGPRTPFGHLLWGLRLLRNPYEPAMALYRRWGPIVQVGLGPLRFVYLFGAEANEPILSTNAKQLTWRDALKSLIRVDRDTALAVNHGADHTSRRRLLQPAFSM